MDGAGCRAASNIWGFSRPAAPSCGTAAPSRRL